MKKTTIFLAFLLIAAAAASAAVSFLRIPDPAYGPMSKAVITVIPTPGDYNSVAQSPFEIWGEIVKITIASAGDQNDFTATVYDSEGIVIFNKSDCNTTASLLSWSLYQDDIEGNPHKAFASAGPITVAVRDINYAAEIQTLTPNATASAGPWQLSWGGYTTAAVDEIVSISEVNEPNEGAFTLSFAGQTTGELAYNSSASQITIALESLSTVGKRNVICTGGPLPDTAVRVQFRRALGSQNVGAITFSDVNLVSADVNETAFYAIDVLTQGQGLVYNSSIANIQSAIDAWELDGDIVAAGQPLSYGRNEIIEIAKAGSPESGTFKLTYELEESGAIAYDTNAADLQTVLEAMTAIGAGNIVCSGGPLPDVNMIIEFVGALELTDVNAVTVTSNTMGGDGADYDITVLQGGRAVVAITFTFDAEFGDAEMFKINGGWLSGPTAMPVTETVKGGSFVDSVTITLLYTEHRY